LSTVSSCRGELPLLESVSVFEVGFNMLVNP
jgi:hypothetical protein